MYIVIRVKQDTRVEVAAGVVVKHQILLDHRLQSDTMKMKIDII